MNTTSKCLAGALVGLMLAGLACLDVSNSAPSADGDDEKRRFQFVRASKMILRLDSALGVVWKVADNGDGGWAMLGATPDDDDEPNWNGRYGLFALKSRVLGGPPQLLRVDRANGRSWLGLAKAGSRWTPIEEGQSPDPAAAGGEDPVADAKPVHLPVVSKEIIEASVGEESEKIAVVVQALEKEGLPMEIKVWAASQLAVFPAEAAMPPLLDALQSEHPEVVVAAIHSLKTLGRPKAIPKILALSSHPDPAVREAVQAVVVNVP